MGLNIIHDNKATAEYATVKRIHVEEYGQPVGTSHNNPLLDTRQYEVHYTGGEP